MLITGPVSSNSTRGSTEGGAKFPWGLPPGSDAPAWVLIVSRTASKEHTIILRAFRVRRVFVDAPSYKVELEAAE